MSTYQDILKRLEAFVRRYHTRQLVKGILLFLGLGLLFWICALSLEYLLWMSPQWRLLLFWIFLGIELFLLYRFIILPLLYLFRLRKGMDHKEASLLIGKHFPEVDDKLYNLLDLSQQPQKSDLLLASIEQRSQRLGPVPFSKAIDFRDTYKYLRYVMLPLLILGFLWVSGNLVAFFNSHQRLVHYDMAFERPAPFSFMVLNEDLRVLDREDFTLRVALQGELRPEFVHLVVDDRQLVMEERDGHFQYTFEATFSSTDFHFTANGWNSAQYSLEVLPTPYLMDFWMELDFPDYLNRSSEEVKGTGNAIVPEGSRVRWMVKGQNVEQVSMEVGDSIQLLEREGAQFSHRLQIFNPLEYKLSSSNAHVQQFEPLEYSIEVIKDEHPRVLVEQFPDSLNPNLAYYSGQAMDDHGIVSISLVYYPLDDVQQSKHVLLERPNNSMQQFYYSFPSGLELEEGRSYGLYFEVVDNDGLRGGKVAKSQTFSTRLLNDKQLKNRELDFQNSSLGQMDRSLGEYKEQQRSLLEINRGQKESRNLTFEDKNRIQDFLERQKQQEELMKKFSNELGESLDKNPSDPKMNELLQERLQRQEKEAQRNAALLEELQELADKMKKEDLQQRLEELGKNQGKNIRNLEQILELTKRYYVTEKAAQLSRELEELGQRQEELSEENGETSAEQQDLNTEFETLDKEVEELQKDNEDLRKPLDIKDSKKERESIKQDQKDALEQLKEDGPKDGESGQSEASKKQKSAAQKMQELSQSLQTGSAGGGASDMEDAAMLRQILDNLLQFSFKQEDLFDHIRSTQVDISEFAATVRDQQELRRLFQHVDDSLFALSLRRAELSEFVNEQVGEVYYNIDRALESLAENQMYQGASHQQYTINATNALADFLANILENMQENLSQGSGGSSNSDFQLPDIIQGQRNLQEQMGYADKQGKQGEGEEGEQGEGETEGEGRSKGEGQEGQEGQGGQGDELGLNEIYEIYKEQQFLKEQLELQLKDMIDKEDRELTEKLLRQMEDFQNDLLENGITQRSMAKVNNIQHQLLKLEDAVLEQGMDRERESQSNLQDFTNPITSKPEQLRESRQGIEILNRQALPLRRKYEQKVKEYFKND